MKRALITGITGQDGAYLAAWLLENNYMVYGAFRRASSCNFWRLQELNILDHPGLELVEHDLLDMGNNIRLLHRIEPDEIYNLAAQSFVQVSFDQPQLTAQATGLGALNMLEAIRTVNPKIAFYQASTSELYGQAVQIPQNEETPFYPRSPYAVAKLFAHWSTVNYREAYNIFGASGILFNHESPLRGREFVTRKITDSVARVKLGQQERLELGNLDAKRDWGFAQEYVQGMHLMLQAAKPDTYVLATGRTESVRSFVELAFRAVDIQLVWEGKGMKEKGVDKDTGKVRVQVNPRYYRPAEVELLIGDPAKAEKQLGWKPETSLEELCRMMVEADIRRNENGLSF
jgi:GDPmannose 4,6-dehydratase